VIFGLPFGRWQTLQTFDSEIRAWQINGTLTKLHLIGPVDDKFDVRAEALLKSYPRPDVITRHGQIPTETISQLLSQVQFALTTSDEFTWSKSTTVMAYLAHGCVVVARSKSTIEPPSLFVRPNEIASLTDVELQTRGDASRRWYETHADWKVLARTIAELITRLPAP
jgi:glycosyltransferase involved in cell wall biosynthesis